MRSKPTRRRRIKDIAPHNRGAFFLPQSPDKPDPNNSLHLTRRPIPCPGKYSYPGQLSLPDLVFPCFAFCFNIRFYSCQSLICLVDVSPELLRERAVRLLPILRLLPVGPDHVQQIAPGRDIQPVSVRGRTISFLDIVELNLLRGIGATRQ